MKNFKDFNAVLERMQILTGAHAFTPTRIVITEKCIPEPETADYITIIGDIHISHLQRHE